jgi:hypothetical protein
MNAKLAFVALGILTSPGLAMADNETCTANDISGTYGLTASGTVLPGNAPGLPEGPVIATGVMTFDKNGHFQGKEMISFNGSVVSGVTFDGTYVVNPDCTLTLEDPGFFHNFGVIVAGGSELFLMSSDSGILLNITLKRTSRR